MSPSPIHVARLVAGFAAGLVVSLSAVSQPVKANFGSGGGHACDFTVLSECVANNGIHTVWNSALEVAQEEATGWTMQYVYDPLTDVVVSWDSDIDADVTVHDGVYTTVDYWGWTECDDAAVFGGVDPRRWCRPQDLFYNLDYPTSYDTLTERRSIACHEFGHTLGLQHASSADDADYASSCMRSGYKTKTGITSHERNHLNGAY